MSRKAHSTVYLDIVVGDGEDHPDEGSRKGRVEIELFDKCVTTSENFRHLCLGTGKVHART